MPTIRAYAAERGEFLLSSEADLSRLEGFFESCSQRRITYPRILIDPIASGSELLLMELGSRLRGKEPRCFAYISGGRNGVGWNLLDLEALRESFGSIFVLPEAEDTTAAQEHLSRLAAFHGLPEVQAAVFKVASPTLRLADATSLDLFAIWKRGVDPVRISELAAAAQVAADAVFESIEQAIEEWLSRAESLRPGKERVAVLWADIKKLADPIANALAAKPARLVMSGFPRMHEAKLALSGPLSRCKREEAAALKDGLRTEHDTSSLVQSIATTQAVVEDFLCTPWRAGGPPRSWLSRMWRLGFRFSGLPEVRKYLRKLLLVLRQVVRSDSFRSAFTVGLVDFCCEDLGEEEVERTAGWSDLLKDSLLKASGVRRGGRTVFAYPKSMVMSREERQDVVGQIERMLGQACEVLLLEQDEAWLYWEEIFAPPQNGFHRQLDALIVGPKFGDARETTSSAGPERLERPASTVAKGSLCTCEKEPPDARGLPGQFPPKTCPKCGGYNKWYWWLCRKHGKVPGEVSCADELCPECILRHLDDPEGFPVETIGRPPGFPRGFVCPNCSKSLPLELFPFFRDGVAGEQREYFQGLAERLGLPEGYRCPNCHTLLIPVDHRERERQGVSGPILLPTGPPHSEAEVPARVDQPSQDELRVARQDGEELFGSVPERV